MYPKCGTPGYVAPEGKPFLQYSKVANLADKNKEYSCVCDIFSCGAVFHLLLTGEGLFPGTGHQELLKLNKECHIDLENERYKILSKEEKHLLYIFYLILSSMMLEIDPTVRVTASKLLKHSYF